MAQSEEQFLLELWDKNICPSCGRNIPPGTRIGSGRKSEGGFCSLDCYAHYHAWDIAERIRRIQAALGN